MPPFVFAVLLTVGCGVSPSEEEAMRTGIARARVRAAASTTAQKVESLGVQRAEAMASAHGASLQIAYLPAKPETTYIDTSRVDTLWLPAEPVRVASAARAKTPREPPETVEVRRPDFGITSVVVGRRPLPTAALVQEEHKKWCITASAGYGARIGNKDDRLGLFVGPAVSAELVCF